jgi:hypothetical protein
VEVRQLWGMTETSPTATVGAIKARQGQSWASRTLPCARHLVPPVRDVMRGALTLPRRPAMCRAAWLGWTVRGSHR